MSSPAARLRLITPDEAPAPTLDTLRTPLHCIAGFAELLSAPGADLGPAETRWARAIAECADELAAALAAYAEAVAKPSDGS